jgi:hypothetical protein
VTIGGIGINNSNSLTVEDLKTKFEEVSVESAVQCAGNVFIKFIETK